MKKFIILISTIIFFLLGDMAFADPKYHEYRKLKKKPNRYLGIQLGKANACDIRYDNSDDYYPFNKIVNISAKSGSIFRIFGGSWITPDIRGELELSGQSHDLEKIKINTSSTTTKGTLSLLNVMGNIYFENKNESIITPFLFGGLGISIGTLKDFHYARQLQGLNKDPGWIAFAYQVGGGLAVSLSDHIILDLSGKYFGSSEGKQKVKVIGGKDYNIKIEHKGNSSFLGGIRFLF